MYNPLNKLGSSLVPNYKMGPYPKPVQATAPAQRVYMQPKVSQAQRSLTPKVSPIGQSLLTKSRKPKQTYRAYPTIGRRK